jgi:hypothetical protein
MNTLNKVYSKLNSEKKTELANHKIELALVQDIIKDAEIAKGKLSSLENLAARRERDYQEVLKIAKKVGVNLDNKIKDAGKFFIELEQKLK